MLSIKSFCDSNRPIYCVKFGKFRGLHKENYLKYERNWQNKISKKYGDYKGLLIYSLRLVIPGILWEDVWRLICRTLLWCEKISLSVFFLAILLVINSQFWLLVAEKCDPLWVTVMVLFWVIKCSESVMHFALLHILYGSQSSPPCKYQVKAQGYCPWL